MRHYIKVEDFLKENKSYIIKNIVIKIQNSSKKNMLFAKFIRIQIEAGTITSKQTVASWVNFRVNKRLKTVKGFHATFTNNCLMVF